MREIKFRAWSGKQMWPDVACYNNEPYVWNYEETELVPLFSSLQKKLYGEPILMQSTGLKDKNGVEIFEGDVVEYIGGTIESGTGIVENIFDTTNLGFRWIKQKTSKLSYIDSVHYYGCASELEVIGNIHQHPELLEGK